MEGTHMFVVAAAFICVLTNFCKSTEGINVPSGQTERVESGAQLPIVFQPDCIEGLVVNELATVQVHMNLTNDISKYVNIGSETEHITLRVVPKHGNIAAIVGNNTIVLNEDSPENCTYCASFTTQGRFLGRTSIGFEVQQENISTDSVQWVPISEQYQVSVIREERAVDKAFIGLVMILVIVANVGMGCKVELDVVKEVLRRPIPPIIGFCCQYIIMPLLSFGLVQAFGISGGLALGFFATGCSPAGGSSNMYTYLLGGDVSLSVTMTLISVLASLGMMPLWMFALSRYMVDSHVKIPFQNIFYTLLSILIPVAVGLLIQHKRPKWAKNISRVLRPAFICLLLVVFTFGVATNLYIFKLISPTLILMACLLPYSSFLLAGLVAFICRQPRNRILTIAIETAIQNTGIPIIIMKLSLPQPEADLSAVSPVTIACFMPLPLWIAVTYVEIKRRCCRGDDTSDIEALPDADEEEEEEADLKANGVKHDADVKQTKAQDVKMFPLDDTVTAPECKEALLSSDDNHNV